MFASDGEESEDDDHVAQGQSVFVVDDVVEDDPHDAQNGDGQIATVATALPITMWCEGNHLKKNMLIIIGSRSCTFFGCLILERFLLFFKLKH